jgi:NTP pyrophosphatase (non-canonical NTP hydrolase)
MTGDDFILYIKDKINKNERLKDSIDGKLVFGMIGLSSEAGEVMDILKKKMFYPNISGHCYNDKFNDSLRDELADTMYHAAIILECLGDSFEDIFDRCKTQADAKGNFNERGYWRDKFKS